MRTLFEEAGAAHRLHYLDVADDVCRERLRTRNAAGTHDFTVTDAQFALFTQYFVAPTQDEGFDLIVHRARGQLRLLPTGAPSAASGLRPWPIGLGYAHLPTGLGGIVHRNHPPTRAFSLWLSPLS